MSRRVTLEQLEPGIALLSMRDEQGRNAFDATFIDELVECLARLAADREVRVGVMRGLPDVFCAGASQDLLQQLAAGEMSASDIILPKLVLDLPVPMIAAMEGHAVGGGLALGLCCDVVLLVRQSRYGCSFINMGFTPGMGTTRLLQHAVGEYVAAEMMLGGQLFKGSRLERFPAINYVLPRDEVWPRALQVARRMAEKPRAALEMLKCYLSLPRRQAFEQTRTIETFMHRLSFAQPDIAEQIRDYYTHAAGTGPRGGQDE